MFALHSSVFSFKVNFAFDTTKLKLLCANILYINKTICFVGGKFPFLECGCSHPCSVFEAFFFLFKQGAT